MEKEFDLLKDRNEGFECHAVNIKTNKYVTMKKWHYFKNGISLCGKYRLEKHNYLQPMSMFDYEICKECLKKLNNKS